MAAETSDPTVYRFRANAFVGERTYRLTEDALTWEEEGKPLDGAFYDEIAEVRMSYAPTRVSTNRFRTQIVFRKGGMAELFNTHYAGFADLPERNAEYAAFLRELHRRLAERGKEVAFRMGSSQAAYIGNLVLTVFIFAGIAFAFVFLFNFGLMWFAAVKLAIILFFVPTLMRFIRRAKPGTYDPRDLPDSVLPAAG
jgi:hypothetical protein